MITFELAEIKSHKIYSNEMFLGCYKIKNDLVDEIHHWTKVNDHLKIKRVLKNSEQKILRRSTDWNIEPSNAYSPWHIYRKALRNCFLDYFKRFEHAEQMAKTLAIVENYNLQHYKPGEGFYRWHKEIDGLDSNITRHLVFMTYLTDTPNAGTEFLYQDVVVPCEKGVTLIWPAHWTHTHRGQISNEHDKLIITGWLSLVSNDKIERKNAEKN